jgi:hypothetical protein
MQGGARPLSREAGRRPPRRSFVTAGLGAVIILAAVAGGLIPRPARAVAPQLSIAVIGDYGYCATACANEQAVANMIHGWSPNYIFTVGDNSYENGGNPPSAVTEVANDQTPYVADVTAGRFFQVTGNHDWGTGTTHSVTPSTNYFGRPPHYVAHFGSGLLDFFATDMNYEDPDGDSATSVQASQYRSAVAASTAIWKITASHQAFWSSGQHGTQTYTQWAILPAIDLFLSGHDHDWEHLIEGGHNFVVDGVGGKNLYTVCATGCIAGSIWHDDTHFGAVKLTITPTALTVQYIAVGGAVMHAFTLTKNGAPAATPTPNATPTPTTTPIAPTPTTTPIAPTPTPTPGPTPAAKPTPSGLVGASGLRLRAAFYYGWFPEAWNQQGMNPFTHYHPSLGYYSSSDQTVIKRQIAAMQYGNIQAGIASWWGQGSRTDARFPMLLSGASGTGFKWAAYYELEAQSDPTPGQIAADLTYIQAHYAGDPSYLTINGKFVVFVYAAGTDGCGMADRWKQGNTVGAFVVLKVFPGFQTCASQPDGWHQYGPAVAESNQRGFSFTISPGFWKGTEATPRLPRDLVRWSTNIRDMIASGAPFQLVTTFNEWGEGTSVESAQEWASSSGYGAYLDALHNNGGLGATAFAPSVPSAAPAGPPSSGSPLTAPSQLGQAISQLSPGAIVHRVQAALTGKGGVISPEVAAWIPLPALLLLLGVLLWLLLLLGSRRRSRPTAPGQPSIGY